MTNITDVDIKAAQRYINDPRHTCGDWPPVQTRDIMNEVFATHRELGAREAIAEVVTWLREAGVQNFGAEFESANRLATTIERGDHRRDAK